MNKIFNFFDLFKREIKKIIWPDKKEVFNIMISISFIVLIFSIILLILDNFIVYLIFYLINNNKNNT